VACRITADGEPRNTSLADGRHSKPETDLKADLMTVNDDHLNRELKKLVGAAALQLPIGTTSEKFGHVGSIDLDRFGSLGTSVRRRKGAQARDKRSQPERSHRCRYPKLRTAN
jgi:hypothetical protein